MSDEVKAAAEAWLAERTAEREAAHGRRRAWLAQAAAEHQEARRHGLRARHRAKLKRVHDATRDERGDR